MTMNARQAGAFTEAINKEEKARERWQQLHGGGLEAANSSRKSQPSTISSSPSTSGPTVHVESNWVPPTSQVPRLSPSFADPLNRAKRDGAFGPSQRTKDLLSSAWKSQHEWATIDDGKSEGDYQRKKYSWEELETAKNYMRENETIMQMKGEKVSEAAHHWLHDEKSNESPFQATNANSISSIPDSLDAQIQEQQVPLPSSFGQTQSTLNPYAAQTSRATSRPAGVPPTPPALPQVRAQLSTRTRAQQAHPAPLPVSSRIAPTHSSSRGWSTGATKYLRIGFYERATDAEKSYRMRGGGALPTHRSYHPVDEKYVDSHNHISPAHLDWTKWSQQAQAYTDAQRKLKH